MVCLWKAIALHGRYSWHQALFAQLRDHLYYLEHPRGKGREEGILEASSGTTESSHNHEQGSLPSASPTSSANDASYRLVARIVDVMHLSRIHAFAVVCRNRPRDMPKFATSSRSCAIDISPLLGRPIQCCRSAPLLGPHMNATVLTKD